MIGDSDDFTEALGEALMMFLRNNGISESAAAKRIGVERATLNTYTHGVGGKRRRPSAEVLVKACAFLGFEFHYEGQIIAAVKTGTRLSTEEKQLHLQFTREFDLADSGGAVAVGLKKPPKKVRLSVSLKAIA